jgi:hypothetical protein
MPACAEQLMPRLRRHLFAVLAALALPSPAPGQTGLFDVPGYVGGGGQYGSVASENPAVDGASGPGFQVVLGRQLTGPLYFDMRLGGIFVDVGPTPDIYYPADRADYAAAALGVLYDFRKPEAEGASPWVALHASYHNFNWNEVFYAINGAGLSPSAGVQVRVRPLGLFRAGLMSSFFFASSNYDAPSNGQSLLVTLDYLFEFGR